MKRKYKLKKEFRKLLILMLGMALASQLIGNSIVYAMNDGTDVIATYEIGVEGNNVIATLTKDGTMTLSGTGDTKDYTSETMPFKDNISNIKDIVVEEGITSIGDALFYNCKDVTGKLIISSTVIEIGDYAFSGDTYESAPKITKIENSFIQSNIVVETPVEKKAEESPAEKNAEKQTAPAVEESVTGNQPQEDGKKQEEQSAQETVKTVKSITEQQIGQSIFMTGQNGGYSCAETNKSFVSAVKDAGYVRADRFVLVRMDSSITQEVPVVNGQLVLPSKPNTLGIPAEDALTSYQFAGWTVEGSDKVLAPKENYAISNDAEELNLTSQWQQTWKINPQVKAEAKEEASIYSVVDSNTQKVLENVDGYTITVQWQINKKDKEDEKSWEDIENATSFTYKRKAEAGDTKNYFRAKLSITKQSKLRSTLKTEIMTTNAVNGISISNPITVTYDGNGGIGSIVNEEIKDGENYKLKENTFTRNDGKVFTGWKITYNNVSVKNNIDKIINNDDILLTSEAINVSMLGDNPSITLTAQWNTLSTVYVDSQLETSGNGSTPEQAVKTIEEAYALLPTNGTIESNKIMIVNDYTFPKGITVLGNVPATITSADKNNKKNLLGNLSGATDVANDFIKCQADTKFENIGLMFQSRNGYALPNGIYGYGHKLIMGQGLTTDGYLTVFGGTRYAEDTVASTDVVVYSGNYSMIAGGGYFGSVTGDTSVTMYGGYVTKTIYAGRGSTSANWETTGTIHGTTFVTIYDMNVDNASFFGIQPTRAGIIDGEGHDYAYVTKMYGGNITKIFGEVHSPYVGIQRKKSLIEVYGGEVTYGIYGGATDSNMYAGTYALRDGVDINIYGGKISQIFGAGNDDYYNKKYQAMSGTRKISVMGGEITGNIYGGSNLGTTEGDTIILIENATVGGNIYGGGNGNNSFRATVTGNVDITIGKNGVVKGSIFGGGNQNSIITKNVDITIKENAEVFNIYGSGNGSKTSITGDSNIEIISGIIKGNVYGGGELGSVGTTNIYISGGAISGSVYGGGNNIGVTTSNITLTNSCSVNGVYGGSNATGTTTKSNVNIAGTVNSSIYAGGNGANTTVTTSNVNIEPTANITGNVFGGGELGAVGTSNVNLNGGTLNGNAFGGGNNVGVTTSYVNINGAITLGNGNAIFGGSNAKGTTENSNVNIKANYTSGKNIYGGGLGAETIVTNATVNMETGAYVDGDIYGGGKEGKVVNTTVNLNGGENIKNIFGGGHLAGVENNVKINSKNGSKARNLFGGSNESGNVQNPVITIEGSVISVYGGGKGSGTVTDSPSIIVSKRTSYTPNIYGGGLEGITKTKSKVTLTQEAQNVIQLFGGGQQAGVEGDTEINIEEGCYAMHVYGGSWVSGEVTGTANVNIAGSSENVFGGGQGERTLVQNTNVVTSTASTISNVYGGSADGIIAQNTELEIDGTISGNVYGAGKGTSSNVNGNTHVVIFGATISGDVFGGGSQGGITGDSHVDLLSGTVEGSAFGGCDQAKVQGNSKVHMGFRAATNQKEPPNKVMVIKKSVYGGGNTSDSGKAFDATNPFVLGNSEVIIDQTDYPLDSTSFMIGEDILGDGNMCVTAGNKTIEIRQMKDYNAAKKLNSIQRADKVILNSAWLELAGSKDSANLLPTVLYSMSRIETLRMDGNVVLYLQKNVNLVRNLESYYDNGNLADQIDAEGAGGNALVLQQGTGFELRTNEDVSRPGYGSVKGYMRLDRYDKDKKPLTDGVYVLGGYDISDSGFVFGQDVYETKPNGGTELVNKYGEIITPETDGKSWNNWRLGRRVDVREITLTVSDRPSYGKTEAVISSWAADGSIYRVDKNSLKITNQNGNTEGFSLVDPESLNKITDINNTFGLEISTGQNGWLEQKTVGHIEGSTSGTGNNLVLTEDYDMIAVEDSKVYPLINVSLSNLTGITAKDTSIPLLVTFNVNTYTKQADGTEMKTGTMTIKVNIIRDATATYNDTTFEAGKNYAGAIQTYEYGTDHNAALTISKGSAITLQYARKAAAGTAAPNKHELSFSTPLPAGTKITMIDKSTAETKYYHYSAVANVSKIGLNEFIGNDTGGTRYTPITSGNAAENYIFIFDFSHASSYTNTAIDAALTAYNNTTVISNKHIVFSVNGNQRVYTLSSLKDSAETFTKYSIGSTIPIDLSTTVDVTGLDGVDTTGRDKQMGARVRLYSVDNNSYINIPSTWEVISQGTHYAAGGNNFTINLSDGLTVTTSDIYIQMSSIGNLPIGKYRLDIDLISGALANYPEDDSALSNKTIQVGFELTDYSYSIDAEMTDTNRQLFSNKDNDKSLSIKVDKTTSSGASTVGVYVRQTLYKKNEDTGEYTAVDLTELFDSSTLPASKTRIPWNKNQLDYQYKENITAGTYRLQFDVMQANAFNGLAKVEDIVRATDTINIVVTDD